MNLLTTEELRQQQLARDLARSRHEPPIEEIASGKSLNDLLHHLTSDPARPKGPNVPLDDEVMQRINVTGPTETAASVGLLKDEGNLQWPQALKGHEFDEPREEPGSENGGRGAGAEIQQPGQAGRPQRPEPGPETAADPGGKIGTIADRLYRRQGLSRSGGFGHPGPRGPERRQVFQPQVQRQERGRTGGRHADQRPGFRRGGPRRRRRLPGAAPGAGGLRLRRFAATALQFTAASAGPGAAQARMP